MRTVFVSHPCSHVGHALVRQLVKTKSYPPPPESDGQNQQDEYDGYNNQQGGYDEPDEPLPDPIPWDLVLSSSTTGAYRPLATIEADLTGARIKRKVDVVHTEEFAKSLLDCDIFFLDNVIDSGLVSWLTEELARLADDSAYTEPKTVIAISSALTWSSTKIDPYDVGGTLVEEDFRRRKPHPAFATQNQAEKLVMKCRRKGLLRTYVVSAGLPYGCGEWMLHSFFRRAWHGVYGALPHLYTEAQKKQEALVQKRQAEQQEALRAPDDLEGGAASAAGAQISSGDPVDILFRDEDGEMALPIIGDGENVVPAIHVMDLARMLVQLARRPRRFRFIIAIDDGQCTQRDIVTAIADALCGGRVKYVPHDAVLVGDTGNSAFADELDYAGGWHAEGKRVQDATTHVLTMDRILEPTSALDIMGDEWRCGGGIATSILNVVKEFREVRGLYPIRLWIHGPPFSGKSTLAESLAAKFKLHHMHLGRILKETLEGDIRQQEEEYYMEILDAVTNSSDGRIPDEYLVDIVRRALRSPKCLNQGFVLDGFPKTDVQAEMLFMEDQQYPPLEPENEWAPTSYPPRGFRNPDGVYSDEEEAEKEAEAAQLEAANTVPLGEEPEESDGEEESEQLLGGCDKHILPQTVILLEAEPEELRFAYEIKDGEGDGHAKELEQGVKDGAEGPTDRVTTLVKEREGEVLDDFERRMLNYQASNTDESSAIFFTDERDIHAIKYVPFKRDEGKNDVHAIDTIDVVTVGQVGAAGDVAASKHDFEPISAFVKQFCDIIGTPHNYGMTKEEKEEQLQEQDDEERKAAAADKAQKEAQEEAAQVQRQKYQAEWQRRLELIDDEEMELLRMQSLPLRQYLVRFVMPTLTAALVQVAKVRPDDPVDFVAEYLFRACAGVVDDPVVGA